MVSRGEAALPSWYEYRGSYMRRSIQTGFELLRRAKPDKERRRTTRTPLPGGPLFTMERLTGAIAKAREGLLSIQNPKGYWVFDLEADTTISSEYILLQRFLGREIGPELRKRLARYLRGRQLEDGGWPLYTGGKADMSVTVKTYLALKLLGDRQDEHHMHRARQLILSLGGAAKVNVFTRITLALFGQVPWHTAPAMPIEIMLLPRWFFFNLYKVSYWSRTVIVPLLILYARRSVCRLGPEEGVAELFVDPPEKLCHLDHFVPKNIYKNVFITLDRLLKLIDPLMPHGPRRKALKRAEQWTIDRMQGEGGNGAIFPAMANAVMALQVLGYPDDHPDVARGRKAIEDLVLTREGEAFCQPCLSPIWDTCLSLSTLLEAGLPAEHKIVTNAVEWLFKEQILVPGDWSYHAPDLESGGWGFQFENTFYPDVDDTPMVLMALLRAGILNKGKYREQIARAVNWVIGMQNSDGGWGSFDINNNYFYLNDIPFADHGALLDPSTSDLTGRCIELLSMLGYGRDFAPIARGLKFLQKEQEVFGGWFGRWGVNYIYGTWSVLMGLKRVGEDMSQPYIRRAGEWLKSCQNPDGGWGETCYSYNDPSLAGKGASTASQTSWALLGLMAAGEIHSSSVQRGVRYLLSIQDSQGGSDEKAFTGTGFPTVFYLRYHGYGHYFPLWALGVYRRLRTGKGSVQDKISLESPVDLSLPALK